MQTVHNLFFLACKTDTEIRLNIGGRGVRNAVKLRRCRKSLERNGSLKISEVCCMGKKDGHIPGLRWVPGMGHELWVLGFMQERIQEQAIVKWKLFYLTIYMPQTECGLSQKVRGLGRNTVHRMWAISESERPWHMGWLVFFNLLFYTGV